MDAGSDRRRAFRAGVARTGDVVRVVLHGPADVTAVDELEAVLQPLPAGGPVEIDLRDVDFLDSSALRVLLRFDARVRRTGAEVRFFMPVLNVPFRLIFAYNPSRAGVLDNTLQPQQKFQFRFAVGTTF